MEQVKLPRGPYETLHDDPATLRSPGPTPAETFIDLQMNIKLMEKSHLPDGEDLASAVESIDEATIHLIADEAAIAAGSGGRVACIACPGVMATLKQTHPDHKNDIMVDFDPRFRGENTFIIPLDGDKPLDAVEHLPRMFHHVFKVIVVDTTFLSFGYSTALESSPRALKSDFSSPGGGQRESGGIGVAYGKAPPTRAPWSNFQSVHVYSQPETLALVGANRAWLSHDDCFPPTAALLEDQVKWPAGDNIALAVPEDAAEVLVEAEAFDASKIVIKTEAKVQTKVAEKIPEKKAKSIPSVATADVGRVGNIMRKATTPITATSAAAAAAAAAASTTTKTAAAAPSSISSAATPLSLEQIEKLTMPKIKEIMVKMGLETTGKKADLIARIRAHLQT